MVTSVSRALNLQKNCQIRSRTGLTGLVSLCYLQGFPLLEFLPLCVAKNRVGVGITIAHDPLHGSGRAGFPHPALALGNNAHASQRIGMTDRRQRQPASDETPHAVPEDAAVLAAPRQRAMPKPADSESKNCQRRLVHGHSVVAKVSTYNRPQPLALFGDGFVHSSPKLGFHLLQLRLQPFPSRLPSS